MKILFANEYFVPFAPGGAEWSMYYWAKELAKANHEISIVTPNLFKDDRQGPCESDGDLLSTGRIKIFRFPFNKTGITPPRVFTSRVFGNSFFTSYFAGQIAKIASKMSSQILVSHGFDSILPVFHAGRELRIPTVATIRDYRTICPISICLHKRDFAPARCSLGDFYRCLGEYSEDYDFHPKLYGLSRSYIRRYLEWNNRARVARVLPQFDGGIFVSDGVRKIYERSGLLPQKTKVIYNLSPEISSQKIGENVFNRLGIDGRNTLLFVGRFSIGKGAQNIQKALSIVRQTMPETRLVIAGNKEYDISDEAVNFVGHLDRQELLSCLRDARAVVMPSRWPEPFSRVLLEALSIGKPVIATKAGGNPEAVIDGVNGFLVERNNPLLFAKACLRILQLPDKEYNLMQSNAISKFQEKFLNEKSVQRLENYLGEVGAK